MPAVPADHSRRLTRREHGPPRRWPPDGNHAPSSPPPTARKPTSKTSTRTKSRRCSVHTVTQAPSAADWPQPNRYDEPRFGTDGAPRGRNQPSGTSRRWQSSKQVFQHGGAGRRHGGHGEGQYGASRGVRSGLARSARILLLRVLARPPCSSVLRNLLAYLGPAARTQHRWVSAGQREEGCISRVDARRADPGRSSGKSMCYGPFAENPRSSREFLRLAVQIRRMHADGTPARSPV